MTFGEVPKGAICANCEQHLATEFWIGKGDMISVIHGAYSYWCKCCALSAQINHAESEWIKLKNSILPLKQQLKSACKKEDK